jgi:transcriptional regulator with XRE-family HTH domain
MLTLMHNLPMPPTSVRPPSGEAEIRMRRRMVECELQQIDVARATGKSRTWVAQELLNNTDKVLRRLLVDEPETADALAKKLKFATGIEMLEFFGVLGELRKALGTPSAVKKLPIFPELKSAVESGESEFLFGYSDDNYYDLANPELFKYIELSRAFLTKANRFEKSSKYRIYLDSKSGNAIITMPDSANADMISYRNATNSAPLFTEGRYLQFIAGITSLHAPGGEE